MINKIHIQKFRSIDHITLAPTQLTAIIGPNSVGKTNILRALDILLGETYPTERAFTKDDFYKKDTSKDIVIQVWFDEPLGTFRLKSCIDYQDSWVEAVSLKLIHSKQDGSKSSLIAVNEEGMEYYANGKVRDAYCLIYIPSDRNLEKQMTASHWTLLGKILKKVDENFRKKKSGETISELEDQFKKAMETPKKILESEFEGDISYKRFKTTFMDICKEYGEGLAHGFDLDLEIYDPLFYYKTIQILAREEHLGDFNVQELGSGVQNLVLLALFRTYAKLMKGNTILAIEEPEIYLYPQAQRQLYKNFRSLAYPEDQNIKTQIFYTTHSPNFIDTPKYDEIILLEKRESTKQKVRIDELASDEREELKLLTEFNNERNELFFADKVVLVEGETEKHALPYLFTTLGYPVEINNISIISANGKDKLRFLVKVSKACGMDWVALYDTDTEIKNKITDLSKDSSDPAKLAKLKVIDEANDELNDKLLSLDSTRVIPLDYNFQSILGLPNHKNNKWKEIKEARDLCSTMLIENIPQEIKKITDIFYPKPTELESSPSKVSAAIAEGEITPEDIPF